MKYWAHPDAAWSDSYGAPRGLKDEPCLHSTTRSRIGSTSRKQPFADFPADTCGRCGRITRGFNMSWRAYIWARRFNAHRSQGQQNEGAES